MLLRQICTRAYNRAVDNVHLLNNHYKAFSSQTYGETSFDRMQMIIQEIVPKVCDILIRLNWHMKMHLYKPLRIHSFQSECSFYFWAFVLFVFSSTLRL